MTGSSFRWMNRWWCYLARYALVVVWEGDHPRSLAHPQHDHSGEHLHTVDAWSKRCLHVEANVTAAKTRDFDLLVQFRRILMKGSWKYFKKNPLEPMNNTYCRLKSHQLTPDQTNTSLPERLMLLQWSFPIEERDQLASQKLLINTTALTSLTKLNKFQLLSWLAW